MTARPTSGAPPRTPAPSANFMVHTRKQLKYIVIGGAVTWFAAIISEIRTLLGDPKGPVRLFTQVSVLLGTITILIFLCLVLLPRVRGVNPNYSNWRDSPELAVVIPVLTTFIIAGWSFLTFTLGTWSSLGIFWSFVGTSGLYALSFGLIGLIPVPDR